MKDIKVHDWVEVIANIDYKGEVGKVVAIDESQKHTIKVEFIDHWAWYNPDELKIDN